MLTLFAGRTEPVTRMEQLDTDALRAALPPPARLRHLRRAEPVRVPVPVALARRERDRRADRGRRRLRRVARLAADARNRETAGVDAFAAIAAVAAAESPLWAAALRPGDEGEPDAVFSPLAPERFALGLETIYEAYLVHYGRPRLFVARRGERARPARRLPLRPRARAGLRGRRRRGGRGDGRADLALRLASRGRRGRRRRGLGRGRARARRRPVAATRSRRRCIAMRRSLGTGTIPR